MFATSMKFSFFFEQTFRGKIVFFFGFLTEACIRLIHDVWWWIWDHVTRWHLLCVSSTGCRSNRGFSLSCVFSSTMPSVADHQATSPNWWSLWRTSRVDPHSVRPRDMICLFHDQNWCRPKGHSLLQHQRPGIDFRWILDSLRTPDCLKNSWRPFYSVRLILPLHSQLDPFLPLFIACNAFVCLTLYMSQWRIQVI